jgi:3-oxoadipate enol-lactonase
MSRQDYFQTEHGDIHWAYNAPKDPGDHQILWPTLLCIHAGVADHTLWDEQVSYFSTKGWGVLRYDIFGYGLSKPTAQYLKTDPRPKVKHHEHAASIARNLIAMNTTPEGTSVAFSSKFVVIGLSRGGGIAIELTVAHPELVCGLVVVAGNLTGIEAPNTAEEKALIGQWYNSMQVGEIEKAATIFYALLGRRSVSKRDSEQTRRQRKALCLVCRHHATRGREGTDPPAVERLSTVKVPVATATGKYDETSTTEGMRLISEKLEAVSVKEFDTAHMVSLEKPRAFNSWIEEYLEKYITICIER